MIFKDKKYIIGIDVGHYSVKIVKIKKTNNGVKLSQAGMIKIMKNQNKTLRQIKDRYGPLSGKIISAIGSKGVIVKEIKLPLMEEKAIRNTIRWEYEEYFPFPLAETVIDYVIISEGEKRMEVMAVFAPRNAVKEHLHSFHNFKVDCVSIQPLALVNLVRFNGEDSEVLIVEIGQENIQLIITTPGRLDYVRNAEISCQEGKTELIISEIERALEYFKLKYENRNIDMIYLSGGGVYANGLLNKVEKEIRINVKILNPFKNIAYTSNCIDKMYRKKGSLSKYAVACGLCLSEVRKDAN